MKFSISGNLITSKLSNYYQISQVSFFNIITTYIYQKQLSLYFQNQFSIKTNNIQINQ